MKTSRLIIILVLCFGISSQAQTAKTIEDLEDFLIKMVENAPNAIPNRATSCNLAAKINSMNLKDLLPDISLSSEAHLSYQVGGEVPPLSFELVDHYIHFSEETTEETTDETDELGIPFEPDTIDYEKYFNVSST